MRTVVIKEFNDKDDLINKKVGEFFDFEDERGNFLIENGYVVEIPDMDELKTAKEKIVKLEKEIKKNKK